ncbi:hypothetical protein B0H13DRAFT_1873239 [Mycena leptocephala]|nr:hypothetical protein B0H13DRAFT_1873239 [Mycena leptocephala]
MQGHPNKLKDTGAAEIVLTEPGLSTIFHAIRGSRIIFQSRVMRCGSLLGKNRGANSGNGLRTGVPKENESGHTIKDKTMKDAPADSMQADNSKMSVVLKMLRGLEVVFVDAAVLIRSEWDPCTGAI